MPGSSEWSSPTPYCRQPLILMQGIDWFTKIAFGGPISGLLARPLAQTTILVLSTAAAGAVIVAADPRIAAPNRAGGFQIFMRIAERAADELLDANQLAQQHLSGLRFGQGQPRYMVGQARQKRPIVNIDFAVV